MASRRSRWKKAVPTLTTLTLTAMPFTVTCPTAMAFFPPINDQVNQGGDPPVTPPVVVVPPVAPPPFEPPVTPPVIVPPVSPPPVVVPPPCECPDDCRTPEPSTLLAGLAGLAAAAGWTGMKRKPRTFTSTDTSFE